MADQSPFPPDALQTNRSGRLTDQQRKWFTSEARGFRKGELSAAIFCVALALVLLLLTSPKSASDRAFLTIAGVGLLIIAGFLVVRSFTGADALTADMRSGKVESVEGAIAKHFRQSTGRSSTTTYYFDVDGQRVTVSRVAYNAAPDAGYVRILFLPQSHHLVNLERLPDHPLPGGMPSPTEIMQIAATAIGSHEGVKAAEAHAQLAAIQNRFMPKGVVPPPAETRDPRPLAEAIIGGWTNGLLTIVFAPDGTVTVRMPGGEERAGRWSVTADGRLVADVMGHQEPTDAWVVGDNLTISVRNNGLTLSRVSASGAQG